MSTRPRTRRDERSVKLVADALEELSRATGVPAVPVLQILTNDLKTRKISARWVPHCFTAEQKQKHLDIATVLKEKFDIDDHSCVELSLLMKYIRDFELELKSQPQRVESYRFFSSKKISSLIKGKSK